MIVEAIEKYCKTEGISICEFEKRTGISNGLVGKWKRGDVTPSIYSLVKIADSTNTHVEVWL